MRRYSMRHTSISRRIVERLRRFASPSLRYWNEPEPHTGTHGSKKRSIIARQFLRNCGAPLSMKKEDLSAAVTLQPAARLGRVLRWSAILSSDLCNGHPFVVEALGAIRSMDRCCADCGTSCVFRAPRLPWNASRLLVKTTSPGCPMLQ